MIFGQGRNTLTAAAFPPGTDILRLHDGGCRWGLLEPTKGSYNWARLDAHLAASEAKGIPSVYVFSDTPPWTAQAVAGAPAGLVDATSNHPPNLQDFTDFVTAIVTRYKGRIKVWEMWNEANYSGFWCGTDAQLLAMAKVLYTTVKRIDPSALVTTPTPCYSWSGNNVITAHTNWFSQGFQNYADIVSFHGYCPDGADSKWIGPTLDSLNSLCLKYGITKPLWDTEYGFKNPSLIPDSAKRQWVIDSIDIRAQKGIATSIWYQADNLTHGTQILQNGTLTIAGQAWLDTYNRYHTMRLPAVTNVKQVR